MIKFRLFGFGNGGETPAADSAPRPEKTDTSAAGAIPTNANGKRVLIVDDDPVFVRATSLKLQSAGYEVATAKDGSEAIATLGERAAHAVLMDINFPADVCNGGMGSWDGFQIMSWLRGLPTSKGARFIMVSNSNSEDYRNRARQLGAVAYFQKPINHDALVAVVNAGN